MSYVLTILSDDTPLPRDIITEPFRQDFFKVGMVIHGRHHKGKRFDTVINASGKELNGDWWEHVKRGLAEEATVIDV